MCCWSCFTLFLLLYIEHCFQRVKCALNALHVTPFVWSFNSCRFLIENRPLVIESTRAPLEYPNMNLLLNRSVKSSQAIICVTFYKNSTLIGVMVTHWGIVLILGASAKQVCEKCSYHGLEVFWLGTHPLPDLNKATTQKQEKHKLSA